MEKMKIVEFHGRGLSFVDSIQADIMFDRAGNIATEMTEKNYKPGILRFKKHGQSAIPVIQYDGCNHDELCVAFQAEHDALGYVDFDVNELANALSYYLRHEGKL